MSWLPHEIVYCSNVHPYSTLDGLREQLIKHVLPIKQKRNLNSMALGLWLNQALVNEILANPEKMLTLTKLFEQEKLIILTLNAFPQETFHAEQVKANVYLPDWSDNARFNYTKQLVKIICQYSSLFNNEVSISTVPLGYKRGWCADKHAIACNHLSSLSKLLAEVKKSAAKHVTVCLEMEPDCVLESSQEMVAFFQNDLMIAKYPEIRRHLGVCFDICHQAVMHENINDSLTLFEKSGITIGKIQVSNALQFNNSDRHVVLTELEPYMHSPYLHQIKTQLHNRILSTDDLSPLTLTRLTEQGVSRVHFHVPINRQKLTDTITTTQKSILATLDYLELAKIKPNLEVETYTWALIDGDADSEQLNQHLVSELTWLTEQLAHRNLLVG
ncbi:metabolite traffic protein EboE [Colwelliaceae bacterium 6471]